MSRSWTLAAALFVAVATPVAAHALDPDRSPVRQLRIYQLFDSTREAFHVRFRDHALRIMARHGFQVDAMWEARTAQGPEFVYLLSWSDEARMRSAWDAFLADEEWIRIKQESAAAHGPMVGEIEDRLLRPTEYGPAAPSEEPAR